jgi:bla regulator protein blaR1
MTTAVAWALIHSLWQAALLALFLLSVRFATRSAQVRYAASVAALACMLGAFAATLLIFLPAQKVVTHPAVVTVLSPAFLEAAIEAPVAAAPDRFSGLTPYIASFWLAGVCLSHVWQLAGNGVGVAPAPAWRVARYRCVGLRSKRRARDGEQDHH